MIKRVLFYFAAAGWLTSLYVNLNALNGINLSAKYPYTWLLHAGVFIVWLPVVLELRNNEELKQLRYASIKTQIANPFAMYNIILRGTPLWLKTLAFTSFFYTMGSFLWFNFGLGHAMGSVHPTSNTIASKNDGASMATFSAVWIFFYGMAGAVLYPYKEIPPEEVTI